MTKCRECVNCQIRQEMIVTIDDESTIIFNEELRCPIVSKLITVDVKECTKFKQK